jgi:endonuclease-3 related protein
MPKKLLEKKREISEFHSLIRNSKSAILLEIYRRLYDTFGPRHWWPGETPFEVMVGAILTQNTSWTNVEKAIQRLKDKDCLDIARVDRLKKSQLASMIKSSGYYRIKAARLKAFIDFVFEQYDGSIERMREEGLPVLREKLLGIKGIGPETADSILLYGLGKPIFVVDAYTQRVLSRHGIILERASYDCVQGLFMTHLPSDEQLFNEYHALLVHLGKLFCKKIPKCEGCPLKGIGQRA